MKEFQTFELLHAAEKNVSEHGKVDYSSKTLAEVGLCESPMAWREQCVRMITALFPESGYVARVWKNESGGGLNFKSIDT
ncbi:MAG: hypothetical protein A2666_04380 [Parcubacteria group bacterium RIFCSPHIGHO2_01_FULL_47_10b]|nr:MAG: hypothetical protein A2666_04380 [Parcubacteria group bacterium RIFCSPHIGHO2_01_FULL_47_10b]